MNTEQSGPIRIAREARGTVPGDGVSLAFGYWPGRRNAAVALHGMTANYVNFIGVAERLRGRVPLLALDFRGRGDSGKPAAGYGFAQHARDVASAMRAMGLEHVPVVGHSMGAFVATALAAQDPELVSALIVIDGGYVLEMPSTPQPAPLNPALAQRIAQLSHTYPSREAYREFWKTQANFPPEVWSPWVEAFLNYEVGGDSPVQPKASSAAVLADLGEILRRDEILARLQAIRCPIFLLRAETGFTRDQPPPFYADSLVPQIRALAPQLEDQKLPGTTHYTIVLGEYGASTIADLIADVASRS